MVAESIGNSKANGTLCMHMLIVFHENRSVPKMESKEVEETIKTVDLIHFIIKKFLIPVN